jgi:hypothetical protein
VATGTTYAVSPSGGGPAESICLQNFFRILGKFRFLMTHHDDKSAEISEHDVGAVQSNKYVAPNPHPPWDIRQLQHRSRPAPSNFLFSIFFFTFPIRAF